jgi:hypothetical protein
MTQDETVAADTRRANAPKTDEKREVNFLNMVEFLMMLPFRT